MAYYQRWEKDLSGGGNYQIHYWPDSKGDETDVSWIFAPFVLLLGGLFKLPIFRNIIGFLIGLPIVLVIGVILIILIVLYIVVAEMVCCWWSILKDLGKDLITFYKWVKGKLGNRTALYTD